MGNFRINLEHLPSRCEICHQADLFDPSTGQCGRCEGVLATVFEAPPSPQTVALRARSGWMNNFKVLRALYFVFLAGLLNLMFQVFTAGPARPTYVPELPSPPVPVNAPPPSVRPEFFFDERQAEIGNLLTDSEMNRGMAVNRLEGRIVSSPTLEWVEGVPGFYFPVKIGSDEFDCFCPRVNLLSDADFAVLQGRIRQKNRITLSGRYDTERRLIFLTRMMLTKEPFRGLEFPSA